VQASSEKRADGRTVTLLFSGGVDSTMAAVILAEHFDRVHLVSYWNGFGHYRIGRTGKRARELQRRFPGRFSHALLSTVELFEPLLEKAIAVDYEKTKSGFIWCMSCKLAMHARTIAYNLEHGIELVSDGSSASTAEMVEQAPFSINKVRGFYGEYGIGFETPVYERPREESIRALKQMGFKTGFRIGDRFLGIQPKCKPGELYYLPFLLLGMEMDHRPEIVVDFINGQLPWARRWIAEYCRGRNIVVPERAS
jgi:predicted subunit of tRNA(5-methylaminomethyl-2-thiouridylate) methyltransferase